MEGSKAQGQAPSAVKTAGGEDAVQSRRSVLRQSKFLRFWIGETVSWFGSQITILAFPLVAISVVGASTRAIGLLVAAGNVATIAVTPFVGHWLDAHAVRPIIIATNVLRAAILVAVPISFYVSSISMPLLYAVTLPVGALTGIFEIAVLTYIPRLVNTAQLVDATSKVSASGAVAETAGPAVGGILIRLITAPAAVIADVISYMVSTVLLCSIRVTEQIPSASPITGTVLQRVSAGIKYCLSHPQLRLLLAATTWFNLCEQTIMTAFLVYAIRVLSISPSALGAVLAAAGGGATIGASVATAVGRRLGLGRAISAGAGIAAVPLIFVPIAAGTVVPFVLGAAFFAHGFGAGLFSVHAVAYRQTVTPADFLGRMNAGYRLFTFGAAPVGAATAGFLGGLIGTRITIFIAATALTMGMALLAVNAWRHIPQKIQSASRPGYT